MTRNGQLKGFTNRDINELNELGFEKLQKDEFEYQLDFLVNSNTADNRNVAVKALCQMLHDAENISVVNETSFQQIHRALSRENNPETICILLALIFIILRRSTASLSNKTRNRRSTQQRKTKDEHEFIFKQEVLETIVCCTTRLSSAAEVQQPKKFESINSSITNSPIKNVNPTTGIRSKRKFAGNNNLNKQDISPMKRALLNQDQQQKDSTNNSLSNTPTGNHGSFQLQGIVLMNSSLSLVTILQRILPSDLWYDIGINIPLPLQSSSLFQENEEDADPTYMHGINAMFCMQSVLVQAFLHQIITDINTLNTSILLKSTDNCGMKQNDDEVMDDEEDEGEQDENEDEEMKIKRILERKMIQLTARKKLLKELQSLVRLPLFPMELKEDEIVNKKEIPNDCEAKQSFLEKTVATVSTHWDALLHLLESGQFVTLDTITNTQSISSHTQWKSSQIIVALSILESSGYYCKENQFLQNEKGFKQNTKKQKNSYPDPSGDNSRNCTTSPPSTKSQRVSTPPPSSSSSSSFTRGANVSASKASTLWDGIFSSPTSSTTSTTTTTPSRVPQELQRSSNKTWIFSQSLFAWIQLLFPHIISFVSYANVTATITSSANNKREGEDTENCNKLEQEEEGEEQFIHRLLSLLSDMFVGGLKCLITLTNHSYSVTEEFLSVIAPNINEHSPSSMNAPVFGNIISMIFYTIHARNDIQTTLKQQQKNHKDESSTTDTAPSTSVLTLKENISERILYDNLLYLLALFANVLESYYTEKMQRTTTLSTYSNRNNLMVTMDSALQITPMMLESQISSLFDENITVHDWLDVSNEWALMHSLKKECTDTSFDWMHYLITQLLHESNHFMKDLEATDHEFQSQSELGNEESQRPPRIQNDDKTTIPTTAAGESTTTITNGDIPLAEIILSAHMVLLLTTLIMTYFAYSQQTMNQQQTYDAWKRLFPRESWWLCIRILKAYLALQGQSEILSSENLSTCMTAINQLQQLDTWTGPSSTQPSALFLSRTSTRQSHTTTAPQGQSKALTSMRNTSSSIQRSYSNNTSLQSTTSLSRASSYSRPTAASTNSVWMMEKQEATKETVVMIDKEQEEEEEVDWIHRSVSMKVSKHTFEGAQQKTFPSSLSTSSVIPLTSTNLSSLQGSRPSSPSFHRTNISEKPSPSVFSTTSSSQTTSSYSQSSSILGRNMTTAPNAPNALKAYGKKVFGRTHSITSNTSSIDTNPDTSTFLFSTSTNTVVPSVINKRIIGSSSSLLERSSTVNTLLDDDEMGVIVAGEEEEEVNEVVEEEEDDRRVNGNIEPVIGTGNKKLEGSFKRRFGTLSSSNQTVLSQQQNNSSHSHGSSVTAKAGSSHGSGWEDDDEDGWLFNRSLSMVSTTASSTITAKKRK